MKPKKYLNENLNEAKNAIDWGYKFIRNPLKNEKGDLDSSSEDSDILVDDNSIQDYNTRLEYSGEENQRNFKDNVYSQPGNSTNDLENWLPSEPPSAKRDQLAVNMKTNRNLV